MKAPVCIVLLSHCCTAFLALSPAPNLSSPRTCALSPAEHVCLSHSSSSSSSSSNSSSRSSSASRPDRRRKTLPGGSRVRGVALGAAKDWLKEGSKGKHGPEGAKGRSSPATTGESPGTRRQSREGKDTTDGEDQDQDTRLYSVKISRATGIEWGTDISFSWVYIRALEPDGAAANCGEISVGDQLIAVNDQILTGAPFDVAMDALIALEGPEVEFTLFRGTTDELKEAVGAKGPPPVITVTVKQTGKPDLALRAPSGANLRDFLTENDINVYQSVTRWTNCKGKQLCGTCIVEINEGLESTTIRSLDESSTLRDNPANYRLSCVTNMYDDVTVTVFPPVGAAQWTR